MLSLLARADSQIDGVPAVVCDAELALREIVDHLHAQDYNRPGFMTGAPALSISLRRRQHFTEFWEQKGVHRIELLSAEKYGAEVGARGVRDYLAGTTAEDRIDVLMCENDILALRAMDEMRENLASTCPKIWPSSASIIYELRSSAYGLTTYEQPHAGNGGSDYPHDFR